MSQVTTTDTGLRERYEVSSYRLKIEIISRGYEKVLCENKSKKYIYIYGFFNLSTRVGVLSRKLKIRVNLLEAEPVCIGNWN